MTQERLAELSALSPDAIRRLERGGFSPTLGTLAKLARGLGLSLPSLLLGLDRGLRDEPRELAEYLARRTRREQRLAWRVVRALFEDS